MSEKTFTQVQASKLEPGNTIRSGKEAFVIKGIEIEGKNLSLSLMGTNETVIASPTQMIWTENPKQFFDFGIEPPEVTVANWADVSEWEWESDFDTD